MTTEYRARIVYLSAPNSVSVYHDEFLKIVPSDVLVEFRSTGVTVTSQYEQAGMGSTVVANVKELLEREPQWQGVCCPGAPRQMQNPDFLPQLRSAIKVPATTSVESAILALKALGVKRTLLLAPFLQKMNVMIQQHLAGEGIEALLRQDAFQEIADASRLAPEEVYTLAVNAFKEVKHAEAIYFQGAPLNPFGSVERLESDLGVPVVASFLAMLWNMLSTLGLRYSIPNVGRLLREWPPVPEA